MIFKNVANFVSFLLEENIYNLEILKKIDFENINSSTNYFIKEVLKSLLDKCGEISLKNSTEKLSDNAKLITLKNELHKAARGLIASKQNAKLRNLSFLINRLED